METLADLLQLQRGVLTVPDLWEFRPPNVTGRNRPIRKVSLPCASAALNLRCPRSPSLRSIARTRLVNVSRGVKRRFTRERRSALL